MEIVIIVVCGVLMVFFIADMLWIMRNKPKGIYKIDTKEDDAILQEMRDELKARFSIVPGTMKEINGKTYQFSGEKQEWVPLKK